MSWKRQRQVADIPGPLARTVRRRRRLLTLFSEERRFWPLFRLLLLPFGLALFLLTSVCGVAAWFGKEVVFEKGQAVTGWQGLSTALIGGLAMAIFFPACFAGFLWVERTVLPAIRRRVFGPKQ